MKLAVLAVVLVAMVPAGPSVSFDSESVRVGDESLTDVVMQLRETPAGFILASKASVEPLARPVSVALAPERTMVLEPGIRVSRTQGGFVLSVHNRRRIELEMAGEKTLLVVPVTVEITERGWKVAGREFEGVEIAARRPQQDDVDQNLNQLGDSAKRILTNPNAKAPPKQDTTAKTIRGRGNEVRRRRPVPEYFGNGLFATSDAFDSSAVTALLHASPTGF
jgi:hypothetical protein